MCNSGSMHLKGQRGFVRGRRGVTFLEAVFAVVLLGMVSATLVGVTSAMRRSHERQQQFLGAAELANRLLVIYRDDVNDLPNPKRPAWYGPAHGEFGYSYRWSLNERPVTMNMSSMARENAQTRQGDTIDFTKRIKVVTVNVWLAEDSGGSMRREEGLPQVAVSRLIDPLAFTNNDRDNRTLERDGVGTVLESIMGTLGSSTGGSSSRSFGTEQGDAP